MTATTESLIHFHQANHNSQTNLWIMYVAATMAAAGFGFTAAPDASALKSTLASIGFLAFTVGQAIMIRRAIRIQDAIEQQLRQSKDENFSIVTGVLLANSMTWRKALITHLFVDTCVVLIIMQSAIHHLLT